MIKFLFLLAGKPDRFFTPGSEIFSMRLAQLHLQTYSKVTLCVRFVQPKNESQVNGLFVGKVFIKHEPISFKMIAFYQDMF